MKLLLLKCCTYTNIGFCVQKKTGYEEKKEWKNIKGEKRKQVVKKNYGSSLQRHQPNHIATTVDHLGLILCVCKMWFLKQTLNVEVVPHFLDIELFRIHEPYLVGKRKCHLQELLSYNMIDFENSPLINCVLLYNYSSKSIVWIYGSWDLVDI